MRLVLFVAAALLAGCAPAPVETPKKDPAAEAWYGPTTRQVAALNSQAASLFAAGRADEAAALVTQAQPLVTRLLTAPLPPLDAMQAVSDADDLYAHMLLRNGYPGEARMVFRKNQLRWKYWKPPTEDSARRLKQAEDGMAECDKKL